MRFLWKSQLKRERGKFLPKASAIHKKTNRKEQLEIKAGRSMGAWLLTIMLWFFFFGTVGYLVFFSPYLALDPPQIAGLSLIDEASFRGVVNSELEQQFFGLLSRNRFFLVRPEKLAETVQSRFPLIRNIRIERIFPSALVITVEERETIVLWCSQEKCFQVLENGDVVPVTDAHHSELSASHTITITDESGQSMEPGERVFEQGFSLFPMTLKRGLEERLGITLDKSMTVSSRFANELRVTTDRGWRLFVSTRLPAQSSIDALTLLLDAELSAEAQSKLQYIDLRTENRIFYRYQDGHEEQINNQPETSNPSGDKINTENAKTEKKKKK